MKRTFALVILSQLIIATASTQSGSQWKVLPESMSIDSNKIITGGLEGWRDIPWGTPTSKVAAIEGMEDMGEGALVKEAVFGGVADVLWLAFCDPDGLTMGAYLAAADYTEPMRYIELFHEWQTNLSDKYGQPTKEGEEWHNTEWRESVERGSMDRGFVLNMGHLSYYSIWLFEDNSAIGLRLDSDVPLMPSGPTLVLGYIQDVSKLGNEKW